MTDTQHHTTKNIAFAILPAGRNRLGKVKAPMAILALALLLTTCHNPVLSPAPDPSPLDTVSQPLVRPINEKKPAQTCAPCNRMGLIRTLF